MKAQAVNKLVALLDSSPNILNELRLLYDNGSIYNFAFVNNTYVVQPTLSLERLEKKDNGPWKWIKY